MGMSEWMTAQPRVLDELQAFDAMKLFIEAYWKLRGEQSDDLSCLLSDISREVWANGMPGDPATWADFQAAVDEVIGNSSP